MHNHFSLLWEGTKQIVKTYTEFKPLQAVVYCFRVTVSKTFYNYVPCPPLYLITIQSAHIPLGPMNPVWLKIYLPDSFDVNRDTELFLLMVFCSSGQSLARIFVYTLFSPLQICWPLSSSH